MMLLFVVDGRRCWFCRLLLNVVVGVVRFCFRWLCLLSVVCCSLLVVVCCSAVVDVCC